MNALFSRLKNEVLGQDYDLSVAFLSPAEMRKAMKYKKLSEPELRRTKTSNVLSFPLSKTSGEILLCRAAAKPYTVEYLFIHGLLHLKGLKHGGTMERAEDTLLEQFHLCKKLLPGSTSAATKSR
jgi:ssRNA-specific RNase YbeY (16S rRNA maturation enzyme)